MRNAFADAWQRSPLRGRFEAMSGRERSLAGMGIAIALALLAYATVKPVVEFRAQAVARQDAEYRDLKWMEGNRDEARLRLDESAPQSQARLSTINAVAKEVGLPLRRIQPEAEGFSVQIERQAFNTVMRFIYTLDQRHGIVISSANIDLQDVGIVNARFSVR